MSLSIQRIHTGTHTYGTTRTVTRRLVVLGWAERMDGDCTARIARLFANLARYF